MEKTIKAKFTKGVIKPLEKLELDEGSEIVVSIKALPKEDRFEESAGGWEDLVDCEALLALRRGLETSYAEMARDSNREREALEWAEGTFMDTAD